MDGIDARFGIYSIASIGKDDPITLTVTAL